jgi:hypothetical protein
MMTVTNITPVVEMLQNEMAAKEVVKMLDEIEYQYAMNCLNSPDQVLNDAANHYYSLRLLRNAFMQVEQQVG